MKRFTNDDMNIAWSVAQQAQIRGVDAKAMVSYMDKLEEEIQSRIAAGTWDDEKDPAA